MCGGGGAEEGLAREVALASLTDKNMAVGEAFQRDQEKGRKEVITEKKGRRVLRKKE